jgi:hypothetical protein
MHGGFVYSIRKRRSNLMSKIFISYSTKDKEFVDSLEKELRFNNFDVWRDKSDIHKGDSIPDKIFRAIRESDIFCAVISSNSLKSNWVNKELNVAVMLEIDYGNPVVIPIQLEKVELPNQICEKSAVRFYAQSFNEGIGDLIKTLNTISEKFSFLDIFFTDTPSKSKKLLTQFISEYQSSTIFIPLVPPPKFSHLYLYIVNIIMELKKSNQRIIIYWEDNSYKILYKDQYRVDHMNLDELQKTIISLCSTNENIEFCTESANVSLLREDRKMIEEFDYIKSIIKISDSYQALKDMSYYQISDDITPYNIERLAFEFFVSHFPGFNINADFIMGSFDRNIFWQTILKHNYFDTHPHPLTLIFNKIYDVGGKEKFSLLSNSLIYPFDDDDNALRKKALQCFGNDNAKEMIMKYFLCSSSVIDSNDILEYFLKYKKAKK